MTVNLALPPGNWTVHWFDPRNGAGQAIANPAIAAASAGLKWALPRRPDALDWVAMAENREQGPSK